MNKIKQKYADLTEAQKKAKSVERIKMLNELNEKEILQRDEAHNTIEEQKADSVETEKVQKEAADLLIEIQKAEAAKNLNAAALPIKAKQYRGPGRG